MIIAEIGWTWQTDSTFKGTAKIEFTHQANLMEGWQSFTCHQQASVSLKRIMNRQVSNWNDTRPCKSVLQLSHMHFCHLYFFFKSVSQSLYHFAFVNLIQCHRTKQDWTGEKITPSQFPICMTGTQVLGSSFSVFQGRLLESCVKIVYTMEYA